MHLLLTNSAAVIGRQLRHQTVTRTSGPLVPPIYKGRPRTPSVFGRPYSPVATSSTQGTGAGGGDPGGGTDSNAYSGSLKAPSLQSKSKTSSNDGPKLRCTWHCFCIALKALSFGLILLAVGAVLFVTGFFLENNYIQSQGRRPDQFDADQRATLMMYRNLTYAGPVVMGLGAVVVIAGLVLTFEERDTLGVKVIPNKPAATKPIPVVITGLSDQTPGSRKNTIPSISSTLASGMTRPATLSVARHAGSESSLTMAQLTPTAGKEGVFDRSRVQETIQETTLSETGSTGKSTTGQQLRQQVSPKRPVVRDECCIFTTSSSSGTSSCRRRLASIETACFGFESPPDIVISDPEACSIRLPVRRRSARCSCSASPTLSSSDLFLEPDEPDRRILDHQRLQLQLLQQQHDLIHQQQQQLAMQRHLLLVQRQESCRAQNSAVAFAESDGLSSASSSSEDVFARRSCGDYSLQPAYQASRQRGRTCYTTAKIHQEYRDSDARTPLLHHEDEALIRPTSNSSTRRHDSLQRNDSMFPLLRPPETF